MEPFNFKQFKVYQDFSAMRVNTDAVLLAAWVNCDLTCAELSCNSNGSELSVLDIGTGTGVISLMIAQRINQLNKPASITAVEIDSATCQDAEKNFKNAPWKGMNFSLHNTSIQNFTKNTRQKFNLILSNPPFFISSLKSPDRNKTTARHTDTLSQSDFINCTLNLIENRGRLAVVLPIIEGKEFLRKIDFIKQASAKVNGNSLILRKLCSVKTTTDKLAKRYLMEFEYANANDNSPYIKEEISIMQQGKYTLKYISLVKEFLLNF